MFFPSFSYFIYLEKEGKEGEDCGHDDRSLDRRSSAIEVREVLIATEVGAEVEVVVNEILVEGKLSIRVLVVIPVHLLELLGRGRNGDAHREADPAVALALGVVGAVVIIIAIVEVILLAVRLLADVPRAAIRDVLDTDEAGLALEGRTDAEIIPNFIVKIIIETIVDITALLVLSDRHSTLALVILGVTEIIETGA